MPADIAVGATSGMHDGEAVKVRITAATGSQIFGFEARLCRGGASIRVDADFRPTLTGNCVSKPLSPKSDDALEIRADPPYRVAEASFRVGAGTDTFTRQDGTPASVTCGSDHPCEIALKVQFPDGFAFRTYPVDYA